MKLKAHLIVLAGNFFFGCSVIAVKQLSPVLMAPIAVNVIRIITALSMFWLLYFFKPSTSIKISKKDWPRLILCALTGIVINQILFVKGSSITSPIHASLLSLSSPICIIILAYFINKEPIKNNMILGIICGLVGAALLIFLKNNNDVQSSVLGDFLIILNAISYGFYLVLAKPLLNKYSGITIIRWAFTIGAFAIIPLGIKEYLAVNFETVIQQPINVLALIFVCVGATFLSYLCITYGLSTLGSQVVGSYIYTQPVFATIAAILLYNEPLNFTKIIAAIFIFTGVYLVNKKLAK